MVDIELRNGFKCQVDEEIVDDAEFMDVVADAENGSVAASKQMVEMVLGKQGKAKLYDFLRDPETKRVSYIAVAECVGEIIEKISDDGEDTGKNF